MTSKSDRWREFLARCPPAVRKVATLYPAHECYVDAEGQSHVKIVRYSWGSEGEVVVVVSHEHGHPWAGSTICDVKPSSLRRCGCGKWVPPTDAEVKEMKEAAKPRYPGDLELGGLYDLAFQRRERGKQL